MYYMYISEKWNFDDPFHKKGSLLVILVPGMIQPLGSVKKMMNEAIEVIAAIEVVEAVEVIETAVVLRTGKSLLSTYL